MELEKVPSGRWDEKPGMFSARSKIALTFRGSTSGFSIFAGPEEWGLEAQGQTLVIPHVVKADNLPGDQPAP